MYKLCTSCKEKLEPTQFSVRRGRIKRDGTPMRISVCKECRREAGREKKRLNLEALENRKVDQKWLVRGNISIGNRGSALSGQA